MFYIDELKVKEIATRLNIDKIVIHAPDKSCGKRRQKIEIYYKAAGIINIHSDDCIAEDGRKERWQNNKSPKTQNGGTAFAVPPHYINTSLSHLG